MERKIKWLRAAYWTAAIADFIVAVLVLIPSRMGVPQYVYPMGLMSAVAFSWGILLIIANRKAIESRWILIPTSIVVGLLGVVGMHAGFSGILPWQKRWAQCICILYRGISTARRRALSFSGQAGNPT